MEAIPCLLERLFAALLLDALEKQISQQFVKWFMSKVTDSSKCSTFGFQWSSIDTRATNSFHISFESYFHGLSIAVLFALNG
jgi:hypothetical protein